MTKKIPIGVKFIGWFQILGALVILFTFNVQQNPPMNVRFAVPFISESVIKICVSIFAIIIAYGYLKQLKWGYWSMLIYSIVFCWISMTQIISYDSQPFVGNATYAAIVTIYTLFNRKHFLKLK